jgi:hypothetical protein
MFRAATLLIVLALAGAPAASLACDLWCTSAMSPEFHRIVGCHNGFSGRTGNAVTAASAECHDAVASTPFLAEARNDVPSPLAVEAALPPDVASVLNGPLAPTRPRDFDLPTPSSALYTILRI